jgi:L-lactate dehydrogenase complex protein LldG
VADSRAAVLDAVRRAQPARAPLPSAEHPWEGPTDLTAAFARACEAAGGRCRPVEDPAALGAELRGLPELAGAARIYSAHAGFAGSHFAAESLADPRRLAGLDAAVVPGAFGVAENGAVWVDAAGLGERALLWLAEHLVLVVPAAELVPHLHAAYARLRFAGPGFGVFVAGPSKTADIEQALVVGAQGPRSTTVVLVGAQGPTKSGSVA